MFGKGYQIDGGSTSRACVIICQSQTGRVCALLSGQVDPAHKTVHERREQASTASLICLQINHIQTCPVWRILEVHMIYLPSALWPKSFSTLAQVFLFHPASHWHQETM